MPRRSAVALTAASLAATAALASAGSLAQAASGPPRGNAVSTAIVVFAPGTGSAEGQDAVRSAGGQVLRPISHVFTGAIVSVPDQAFAALQRNPNVSVIEKDAAVRATSTQSQPTWGLDRVDQRALPLSSSYTYPDSAGRGVTAYVVDTGIRADHTDFGGRVTAGYTTITDGGGTADCNGHGTHVAGTIAGATWGVAKAATLVPVRVLDCNGSGTWSGVVSGLDWVAAQHADGVPAVANMSLGGGASSTVDSAVQGVINDGVTVVVAAGNSNADACTSSPARVAAALTIAATDTSDTRASFSNFGSCVDMFAPGVSITSAGIASTTATATYSGTSMASPHVAGLAALYLAGNMSASPDTVGAALNSGATPNVVVNAAGSPNRLAYVTTGSASTATAPATPAAPKAASAGPRSALVSWVAPADGGSTITSYTVTAYSSTGARNTFTASGTATSVKVSVKKGTYTFTVRAVNAIGSSLESARSNSLTVN